MSMDAATAQAIKVARALGDPTRFRLLQAIASREEISCQELTALFPIAQATVSHHLKVLSDAGLVTAERRGQFHYYRARPAALDAHGRTLSRAFGPRPRRGRAGAERR
jgi:ArsR family transcriptional regulator, arsenate/arsenite/antimonite-responsive transcriptional repressor